MIKGEDAVFPNGGNILMMMIIMITNTIRLGDSENVIITVGHLMAALV